MCVNLRQTVFKYNNNSHETDTELLGPPSPSSEKNDTLPLPIDIYHKSPFYEDSYSTTHILNRKSVKSSFVGLLPTPAGDRFDEISISSM